MCTRRCAVRREKKGTREKERYGYEREVSMAHQHSKYSVEGGRGSLGQRRNKNLRREVDVALIFIREKRSCYVEKREYEIESRREMVEMKCKCFNKSLKNYGGTYIHRYT